MLSSRCTMIGPASGPSGMSTREVVDNPVRVKRKVFEDIDIESLCDKICPGPGKKRFIGESSEMIDATIIENLVEPTTEAGTVSSGSSTQEITSVARLEVLVVDGTWDPSSITNAEFADMSSAIAHDTVLQSLENVESVDENCAYGTILSYWQPETENPENPNDVEIQPTIQPHQPSASVLPNLPSPPVEDQENGNLSWLLDFKLDSFIEAPEDRTSPPLVGQKNRYTNSSRSNGTTLYNDSRKNVTSVPENGAIVMANGSLQNETRQSYVLPENRTSFAASRYAGPKKPPFTYTELIEHALQERGELTVSAIYQWISEHFPYYKSNDDRWKNSVRHNLSINPHFRKGSKAPHGAGHLWAIANRGDTRPRQLTALNGTIVQSQRQFVKSIIDIDNPRKQPDVNSQIVTMDEVTAATASISQPEENEVVENSVTLELCAEQILSGIKREVEVQYLVPMAVPAGETVQDIQQTELHEQPNPSKDTERDCWNVLADFLNPVSKEEVAEECGLIGESYLVTDLNPTALGLNMVEPEIITPDNLFGEELSFQFYEFTSPSQLQSA